MFTVRLENIKIRQDLQNEEIAKIAYTKFNIMQEYVSDYKIVKKSIDARDKNDIFYNYSVIVFLKDNFKIDKLLKNKNAVLIEEKADTKAENNVKTSYSKNNKRPVIIGAGPAGLFCALTLIENGVKPIIVEQGKTVEERQKDVELFLKERILNTCSNVQFGEGGAGTFSDGKLTTNLHSPLCREVIDTFVKFGAPEEISYINKPHIGTDNLVNIVANIRKYIENNGGKFLFGTKAEDFEIENNQIKAVLVSRKNNTNEAESKQTNFNDYHENAIPNKSLSTNNVANCQDDVKINQTKSKQANEQFEKIETNAVVLAIGHSSRDMFKTLYEKHIEMEKKNFSVGVRIEHKQQMINESQYGKNPKLKLPPAEYKLAYHGEDRSCYTFCMCPGGTVMASSSEKGTIVTNGMSTFARDGENANSAVLVNVTPEDFKGDSPLEGMYFQQELEEKAFKLGGSNYNAPIQRVEDFLNNRKSTFIGEVKPTYKPGVTLANLQEILPEFVVKTLKEGLLYFDKKIEGFASKDAILTGVETRSSSPVTIKRNEQKMASVYGMYPCGEGAGYAGGIMSAAVDGIKVANAMLEQ